MSICDVRLWAALATEDESTDVHIALPLVT
jgi:hypothetical protein